MCASRLPKSYRNVEAFLSMLLPSLTFHVNILASIAHVKAKSWQVLVISIYISQWSSSSLKLTFIYFAHFSAGLLVLYLPVCRTPWMLCATLRVLWCTCHMTLSAYHFLFPRINSDFCHTWIFICSNLAIFFFMDSMFFTLLEKVLLFHLKVVQMFLYISF